MNNNYNYFETSFTVQIKGSNPVRTVCIQTVICVIKIRENIPGHKNLLLKIWSAYIPFALILANHINNNRPQFITNNYIFK